MSHRQRDISKAGDETSSYRREMSDRGNHTVLLSIIIIIVIYRKAYSALSNHNKCTLKSITKF